MGINVRMLSAIASTWSPSLPIAVESSAYLSCVPALLILNLPGANGIDILRPWKEIQTGEGSFDVNLDYNCRLLIAALLSCCQAAFKGIAVYIPVGGVQ